MRVVFLGNHTVGVNVLEELHRSCRVAGVVAHPLYPQDTVRYLSVYDRAVELGLDVIRAAGRDQRTKDFITERKPDLIWTTDYRYLLPQDILSLPSLGAVNLHPSLLPAYRGRAAINWQILKGEERLGLTAHFLDTGMDTGDVIHQIAYRLRPWLDVGHALEILYPLYRHMTRKVVARFMAGPVRGVPQDHSLATAFPARKPGDGRIDWTRPAREVRNLVRAVARPYPGAFTRHEGENIYIWKAVVHSDDAAGAEPGRVLEAAENRLLIQCGRGVLDVLEYERHEKPDGKVPAGTLLGNDGQ